MPHGFGTLSRMPVSWVTGVALGGFQASVALATPGTLKGLYGLSRLPMQVCGGRRDLAASS